VSILVVAEKFINQLKSVSRVVRPQVLDLGLDKFLERAKERHEALVVEFVKDAQIQHSVPLHAPQVVVTLLDHLFSLVQKLLRGRR
jgi:hypothetical protein